jgi:hypothetical protein
MDILRKTIKKLSDEEYQSLLNQVAGKKKNKPYYVLEATRKDVDFDDTELMQKLQVNPSAYYTLKSRLNNKIAEILSKKVENPIRELMEEVVRVPATLYGTNREFSIRALKELEKQLKEYDMSNELITVYKTLALLHLHHEDYEYYQKQYNKHIAFALAVSKAEQLFFQFIKKMGYYHLTLDSDILEELIMMKRELSNITEMYDSHRLYVLYNIVRIYYLCGIPSKHAELKSLELEVEGILKRIDEIFKTYPLDTLYNNLSPLVNILHYEYYQKIKNQVRADHYLSQQINDVILDWSEKHALHYFIIQYLNSRIEKFLADGEIHRLIDFNQKLEKAFELNVNEPYHYISFKKYIAICKFYNKDYQGAARTLYDLRNNISLKQFQHSDIECKLLQGLCYCLMGEDSLANQIISSIKRQIADSEEEYEATSIFIKILKTALKPSDFRRKIVRINELLVRFDEANKGSKPILTNIRMDDALIRKMTNPIKD